MDMEKDKNKSKPNEEVREPFPPENTPRPPQVMDASKHPADISGEEEKSSDKKKAEKKPQKKEPSSGEEDTGKRLGDPMEIDDETTI